MIFGSRYRVVDLPWYLEWYLKTTEIHGSYHGRKSFCTWWHLCSSHRCMMSAFSVRIITCSHQFYRISVHLNSRGTRCISLYPSTWFISSAISLMLCWVQNVTRPRNLLWGLGHYCWYIWAYTVFYILSRYLTLSVFRETGNITRPALLSLGKPAYKAILCNG